ncbi:MAG TPA: AAA family ATPase [Halothiobacillus sp.]|nr:AAA family ATPase [Halothiobacillus sp.]
MDISSPIDSDIIEHPTSPANPAITPKPLTSISAHELLALEMKPRNLLLAPWLPEGGLTMVYGPRGIGKTHLVLGCAWAIASGGAFLNWKAPEQCKVLIVDGEMPGQVLQERLAVLARDATQEPPPGYLRFLPMDMQERGLDIGNAEDQEALEVVISDAAVIIVDNISTLSRGGKENEGESWLPVQEWALRQRRNGKSVIFVHHAGKGGQQRGTSRREDVLDTVISLRMPQDHEADQGARFEVHFEKNRGFYGDDAKPFEAALGATGWTLRDIADADMARVVALSDDGFSVRDIASEMNITPSRVGRIQKKAREAGKLTTPPPKAGRKSRSDPPAEHGDD